MRGSRCPYDMGQFFYFQNKLRHRLRHTSVHVARIFWDVARGKWRPKSPKSLLLLAHNSIRLWPLELCFSIFVVSCSSSSEIRQYDCMKNYCMKKVVLKKCSCSYCKKKRDVSGRTPSPVVNDAVDKTKRL